MNKQIRGLIPNILEVGLLDSIALETFRTEWIFLHFKLYIFFRWEISWMKTIISESPQLKIYLQYVGLKHGESTVWILPVKFSMDTNKNHTQDIFQEHGNRL